jgi:hypothetical protein
MVAVGRRRGAAKQVCHAFLEHVVGSVHLRRGWVGAEMQARVPRVWRCSSIADENWVWLGIYI